MTKLTFFPLGNADCCRIDLEDGQKLLFDFAATRDPSDSNDLRIDLPKELKDDLCRADRNHYEVVAFTHLDKDHYTGASEFFYLEHARKYQGPGRVQINCLWVPAASIVEEDLDEEEARIIQEEARFRLREGKGIRVFSRPEALEDWLASQGLTVKDRAHLITDAGQLVPEFTAYNDGVEFFVHSPFASLLEDGSYIDRNRESIVVQAAFLHGSRFTKVILGSDVDHEALADIVSITCQKGNEARLEWDVFKLPHHCSYLSLGPGPDKGTTKTKPVPEVKWLFEEQGQRRGIAVSTSKPIPTEDEIQPPHKQAAAYYREALKALGGEFKVTMEHPSVSKPEKLEIAIHDTGATVQKRIISAPMIAATTRTPRAGCGYGDGLPL